MNCGLFFFPDITNSWCIQSKGRNKSKQHRRKDTRMSYIYWDVKLDGKEVGRIVVELYDEQAPCSVSTLKKLVCEAEGPRQMQSLKINKIIKNFILQLEPVDTSSVVENRVDIDSSFLVCMSDKLDQFSLFITLQPAPHLNKRHNVIGRIVHGKNIVREIEKVDILSNKQSDADAWIPVCDITIERSGLWDETMELPNSLACTDPIGGDVYEEYPDDNDGIDFENVENSLKITETIKLSADLLFKEKRLQDSILKYNKSLRYCNELIPDENSKKELFDRFLQIKLKIYMNLSLIHLKLGNSLKCIDYCGFILQLEESEKSIDLTNVQLSKIFYRLGKSYNNLKKYDIALDFLKKCLLFSPNDALVKAEYNIANEQVTSVNMKNRKNFEKFLSK